MLTGTCKTHKHSFPASPQHTRFACVGKGYYQESNFSHFFLLCNKYIFVLLPMTENASTEEIPLDWRKEVTMRSEIAYVYTSGTTGLFC